MSKYGHKVSQTWHQSWILHVNFLIFLPPTLKSADGILSPPAKRLILPYNVGNETTLELNESE